MTTISNSSDTAIRLNELIIAVNELASDVKRVQIMSQDILLRTRQSEHPTLFDDPHNVTAITDAHR